MNNINIQKNIELFYRPRDQKKEEYFVNRNIFTRYNFHEMDDILVKEISISKKQGHYSKTATSILNKMIVCCMFDYLRPGCNMGHLGDVLYGRFVYDNFDAYDSIIETLKVALRNYNLNHINAESGTYTSRYFYQIIVNSVVVYSNQKDRKDRWNRRGKIANLLYDDIKNNTRDELNSWLKPNLVESKEVGKLNRACQLIFRHLILESLVYLKRSDFKHIDMFAHKLFYSKLDHYFYVYSALGKQYTNYREDVHPDRNYVSQYITNIIEKYNREFNVVDRKEKIVNFLMDG